MKYKVGDKARVSNDLEEGDDCPYIYEGIERSMAVASEMEQLCGEIVTIRSIDGNTCTIEELYGYTWVESMFDDNAYEEINKSSKVKEGDVFTIREDLVSSSRSYRYYDLGDGEHRSLTVTGRSERLAGQVATIKFVDGDGTFKIDLDNQRDWWCLSMFKKETDKEEENKLSVPSKYAFYEDIHSDLCGYALKHMHEGEKVKVIPFVIYNGDPVYWKETKYGTLVNRPRYSILRKLINKPLVVNRVYSDGDVDFNYKDENGNMQSAYAPQCCLMPWDMKVSELPRPKVTQMERLYDAYIAKYEKEEKKEERKDSFEAPNYEIGYYIKLKDGINPHATYYYKGKEFKVSPQVIKKLKDKVLLVTEIVRESTDADSYVVFHTLCSDGIWRKDNGLVIFTDCRCVLFEKTEAPTVTIKVTDGDQELVDLTRKTKGTLLEELKELGEEPSNYVNEDKITIASKILELKSKNNMNDESEDINMSKLGLGGMLTKMFGEVGEVKDASLALTLTGEIAAKRKDGDFVRYDATQEVFENQGSLIFPGSEKFMLLMPSAEVLVGDVIKYKGKYLQVLEVKENGSLSTVNYETGTKTTVIKETNLFNMQFYTKVVSMMTGMNGGNTTNGGFNPMMMLLLNKDEDGKEMDMTTMMMLSGMFGGQNGQAMNPMVMMMLADKEEGGDSLMKDVMMMSMFMGGNSPFGNLFSQAITPVQIAEPIKTSVADDGKDALIAAQAEAIKNLTAQIRGEGKDSNEEAVTGTGSRAGQKKTRKDANLDTTTDK